MKLYIKKGAEEEPCYDIDHYKDEIRFGVYSEVVLFGAKIEYGGYMWCSVEGEHVERGECGKDECEYYAPCNGKSGRCRNLKNCYKSDGTEYLLTKDGLTKLT